MSEISSLIVLHAVVILSIVYICTWVYTRYNPVSFLESFKYFLIHVGVPSAVIIALLYAVGVMGG